MTTQPIQLNDFAVVVACNDDKVLNSSLLRSPEISSIREVVVRKGFNAATQAYNSGLEHSTAEYVVFVHQDVYFPDGWFKSVAETIAALSVKDPDWAVLGVFGICTGGQEAGHIYSTGIQRVLGRPFDQPIEIGALDEVVLIMRRGCHLRFDADLLGFHLYGTDICQTARGQGMKCYAISAFCVHNSNGLEMLPGAYAKAFFYMRRKWSKQLPIRTPCMTITRWAVPLSRHYVESWLGLNRKRGGRCDDPAALYRQLLQEKRVATMGVAALAQ